MAPTHKVQFNLRNGEPRDASHSMIELSMMTGIPEDILEEVAKRGRGAWKTNIRSVRTKGTFKKNQNLPRSQKLSAEQWGIARVYAFINKLQKGVTLDHDIDLAKRILGIGFVLV